MTTRIPRNATRVFYATETVYRSNGRFAGREQRSTTFREAKEFLDRLDVPGQVSVWSARSNLTSSYADRRPDGTWVSVDRLTGKRMALDPATGQWVPLTETSTTA